MFAYGRELRPISHFKIHWLNSYGWQETLELARFLCDIDFWAPSEWHETSVWQNSVRFYSAHDLVTRWVSLSEDQRVLYQEKLKAHKNRNNRGRQVTGSFKVFTGGFGNRKFVGKEYFKGTLRGSTITTEDGQKKRANGKHISYEFIGE